MSHKLIPTDSILVQSGYNDLVRTPKETAANAKEVAATMAAQGDEPTLHPVRFVKIGNDKFTRNHATLLAAKLRAWPNVYAVESPFAPGSKEDMLDLILSNNGGHPVSRVAQGNLYKAMRDGEKQELTKEEIDALPVGEEAPVMWIREPMTLEQIAEACKPAISSEHVRQCIVLADSTPEIRDLIERGQVALNIVIKSKSLAKDDDAKQLKILKRCVACAKADDKETATLKHFDAIKAEFMPAKKLRADDGKEKDESKPENYEQAMGRVERNSESATQLPTAGELQEISNEAGELFGKAESELLTEGTKKNNKLKLALATRFLDTDGLEKLGITMSLTNEEADLLAEEVLEIISNAREVF